MLFFILLLLLLLLLLLILLLLFLMLMPLLRLLLLYCDYLWTLPSFPFHSFQIDLPIRAYVWYLQCVLNGGGHLHNNSSTRHFPTRAQTDGFLCISLPLFELNHTVSVLLYIQILNQCTTVKYEIRELHSNIHWTLSHTNVLHWSRLKLHLFKCCKTVFLSLFNYMQHNVLFFDRTP